MNKNGNLFYKKLDIFWLKKANIISWIKKPLTALTNSHKYNHWFKNGLLNVYDNCITRNINSKLNNKVALITIDNKKKIKKFTYEDIDLLVNKFISYLFMNNKSFLKGKPKMMIHSSASIESAISMLAGAKLGIHFSVIFEELEDKAIESRINLFKPDIFITKLTKDEFIKKYKIIYRKNKKNIIFFENFFKRSSTNSFTFKSKILNSNSNFFTLFTSGSTGVPKGITHSYGGYLVYSKLTCIEKFGMKKNSVVLAGSDAGWINGHTYALFGPLSIGSTTILLQSPLLILDKKILNKIIRLKVDILYLPVTIIRMMKSLFQNSSFKKNNFKTLGSMGEPLAPSVGNWYANFFGKNKKAIVNTYFQTETGGIICSPRFKDLEKKVTHGSVGKTLTKYIKINDLDAKNPKEIKIISPWPGCMKNVLNGKKEWNKYWDSDGNFKLFDLATKFKDNIYIHGRTDDVINIRGHRIGSEEIESTVLKINKIAECCAVSVDDEFEGSKINLFIVSSTKATKIIEREIFSNFGSFALPKKIIYVKELPKTRSGKILRRLLRSLLLNPDAKSYGDLTTMLNPKIISNIKNAIKEYA